VDNVVKQIHTKDTLNKVADKTEQDDAARGSKLDKVKVLSVASLYTFFPATFAGADVYIDEQVPKFQISRACVNVPLLKIMCAAIQLELFTEAFKESNIWLAVGIDVSTGNVKDLKSNNTTNALKVMMLPTREDPPKVELFPGRHCFTHASEPLLLVDANYG
jgi:hypothetical protein